MMSQQTTKCALSGDVCSNKPGSYLLYSDIWLHTLYHFSIFKGMRDNQGQRMNNRLAFQVNNINKLFERRLLNAMYVYFGRGLHIQCFR